MTSHPTRRRHRFAAALAAATMLIALAPLTAGAQTADPPPPQDTSLFCENASADNPFTDLSSENVHFENVLCLVAADITQGTTETTYSPDDGVRRDQMASFIARLIDTANQLEAEGAALNELPPYDGENQFDDVSEDNVHVDNINRLADAGIALGKESGDYDADGVVTRGQMASFINRAQEHLSGAAFTTEEDFFADDETSVHEDNINGIASEGIYVGTGGAIADPQGPTQRDQMGSFLIRHLAVNEAAGAITALPGAAAGPQTLTAPAAGLGDPGAIVDADAGTADEADTDDVWVLWFDEPVELDGTATIQVTDGTGNVASVEQGTNANMTVSDSIVPGLTTVTIGLTDALDDAGTPLAYPLTITDATGVANTSGTAWAPEGDLELEADGAEILSYGVSGTEITLVFNEALNQASATNPLNYLYDADGSGAAPVSDATLGPDFRTVTLTVDTEPVAGDATLEIIDTLIDSDGDSSPNGPFDPTS